MKILLLCDRWYILPWLVTCSVNSFLTSFVQLSSSDEWYLIAVSFLFFLGTSLKLWYNSHPSQRGRPRDCIAWCSGGQFWLSPSHTRSMRPQHPMDECLLYFFIYRGLCCTEAFAYIHINMYIYIYNRIKVCIYIILHSNFAVIYVYIIVGIFLLS